MALGTPTLIGSVHAAAPTSAQTSTYVTDGAVPSGATAFVTVHTSTVARPLLSVVDSVGNIWTICGHSMHITQSVNTAMAYCYMPSGLAAGTTITANFSNVVSAVTAIHMGYFTGRGHWDDTSKNSSSATGTAWSSGASPATWKANGLAIGSAFLLAASSNGDTSGSSPSFTELADTNGGARTAVTTFAAGLSLGAAITAAGTWAAANHWAALVTTFVEYVAPDTTKDPTRTIASNFEAGAGSAHLLLDDGTRQPTAVSVTGDFLGSNTLNNSFEVGFNAIGNPLTRVELWVGERVFDTTIRFDIRNGASAIATLTTDGQYAAAGGWKRICYTGALTSGEADALTALGQVTVGGVNPARIASLYLDSWFSVGNAYVKAGLGIVGP